VTDEETCSTCGCTIGGGCPSSTIDERVAYILKNPKDFDWDTYRAAQILNNRDDFDMELIEWAEGILK
jgi:hypothetical protein